MSRTLSVDGLSHTWKWLAIGESVLLLVETGIALARKAGNVEVDMRGVLHISFRNVAIQRLRLSIGGIESVVVHGPRWMPRATTRLRSDIVLTNSRTPPLQALTRHGLKKWFETQKRLL